MKHLIALLLIAFSSNTFANTERKSSFSYSMPSLEVGFRWASANIVGADSNKQVLGFEVGGSTVFNLNETFGIRTGLFYVERPFESSTILSTSNIKGKLTYFDIPVHLMFKLEDYAGIYLGPSVSFKLSDDINNGLKLDKIKTSVIPLTFGAQFKFAPNFGLNIYFESVSGELAQGLENSRAVGANLMIAFD